MTGTSLSDPNGLDGRTTVNRKSDRELVVTCSFNARVHAVFQAWSMPELFRRWWIPKATGMTIVACEMDVRTGGRYRLDITPPGSDQPMAFFGKYLEVVPDELIVWTNEEEDGGAVTTVTFEANNGKTQVTLTERYPTTQALDDALEGSATALPEQFVQLDELLAPSGLGSRK
jgi:uncharacterized protein YndB with AHSA1/START domain